MLWKEPFTCWVTKNCEGTAGMTCRTMVFNLSAKLRVQGAPQETIMKWGEGQIYQAILSPVSTGHTAFKYLFHVWQNSFIICEDGSVDGALAAYGGRPCIPAHKDKVESNVGRRPTSFLRFCPSASRCQCQTCSSTNAVSLLFIFSTFFF